MLSVCGQDASGGGRASGARLPPVPPYLHVGPDLSLAARTVWDETLASQGRGAGVAPVERMEPNYRPVCHLLWEKVVGGRARTFLFPYDTKYIFPSILILSQMMFKLSEEMQNSLRS